MTATYYITVTLTVVNVFLAECAHAVGEGYLLEKGKTLLRIRCKIQNLFTYSEIAELAECLNHIPAKLTKGVAACLEVRKKGRRMGRFSLVV